MCGVKETAQAHRNCAFVFEIRKVKENTTHSANEKVLKVLGFLKKNPYGTLWTLVWEKIQTRWAGLKLSKCIEMYGYVIQ